MPDYSAGTASVRIKPNADAFLKDLEAQLRTKRDPRFTVTVDADTAQAKADIDRFRQIQQRNGLQMGVDVALGQAQADMAAFRQRQQRDGLTLKVDADTGKAQAEVAALRRQVSSIGSMGGALRLNIGAGLLAGVQPAATGLAELAAAMQQVAQAGLALPGVIAGAAASVGTLAFGLSGISDAYKAVSQAATSSGTDQEAAARTAVSASNNLRNAIVDEAQARKDVAQATREASQELRDLQIQQRGGMIDESRAILEAQQARERLASGKFTDVRDALLDVQEADQRLMETRERNAQTATKLNDANVKGVAGNDQVVASNERLTRSHQQVAEAQMAVADSGSSVSSAQKKADEAMKNLGPNAQSLVRTFIEMKPAFMDVRTAISEPLLEGKAEEFKKFFTTVRPIVEQGGAEIATGWNKNITALFGSISSNEGKGLLDRILGNTGEAQSRLTQAIDPIVKGIGVLSAAGTDSLPRLADGLADVSTRFRNFITQADSDGRLDKWINDGLDGLTSLGNSVLNIGKSFTAITGAAGGGGSFLKWLEDATGRLQTFLNSTEGQNKLQEYFAQGRDMASEFVPLLKELPDAFKAVSDGASMYVGSGLLPLLAEVAKLLGDNPELVKTAVAAYLAFNTVAPIMGGVTNAIGKVANGVTNLGTGFADTRKRASDAMDGTVAAFDKAGGPKGVGKFAGALSALGANSGPLVAVASVAIPLLIQGLGNLNAAHDEAAKHVQSLNDAEKDLEKTLDRVSGKVTAQTRETAIDQARNFDLPGNITKGDAVKAATQLGIAPDLYADALVGKPEAVNQVRDILTKNNLIPEFQVNKDLGQRLNDIRGATKDKTTGQDKLTDQDIFNALLGDEAAKTKFYDAFKGTGIDPSNQANSKYSLFNIAQGLSATGQASILAGGALNTAVGVLPGAQQNVNETNQANFGRFRTKPGSLFPPGITANATGPLAADETQFKINVPATLENGLRASGIPFIVNGDGSLTATVPKDSPYIEKYKQGSRGRTPGGRSQGFLAELHGQEWVHDAGTVDRYGPEVMNAMWRGQIDPKALKGLVPGFAVGGPTDPNDPNYAGIATGAAPGGAQPGPAVQPGSVAPNPYGGPGQGGINGIVSSFIGGMQGPIANITSLIQQGISQGQGDPAAGGAGGGGFSMANVPGLWGLIGSMGNPDAMNAWTTNTMNWLGGWAGNTLSSAANIGIQGSLGALGLENSVLSPNNPWTGAALQGVDHFAGLMQPGPGVGPMAGIGGLSGDPASLAAGNPMLTPQFLQSLYGSGGISADGTFSPAAQAAIQYAQTHAVGQAYDYGGIGVTSDPNAIGGYDCSGIASSIYAAAKGLPQGQRYFTTESDFEALGFQPGYQPGALNIGVMRGGGGPNSHMVLTLPNGVNVESGGAHGTTVYGGEARGATDLPLHWYLPLPSSQTGVGTVPGVFLTGGHTPGSASTPVPAILHGDEFVQRNAAVEKYGLPFMHALNQGKVDPADLPQFLDGGAVRDFVKTAAAPRPAPTPPKPNFQTPNVKPMQPQAPVARAPSAAPAPRTATPAPGPAPVPTGPRPGPAQGMPASTPPPVASVAPGGSGSGPAGTNHTLPWINKAIESGASALGQAASTAIGVAAGAAAGAAGIPGLGAIGAIGPYVAGLVQQGGKVVEGVANVISSAFVGSVPGSFTTTPEAYGQSMRPAQRELATAMPSSSTTYGPFYGHDTPSVMQAIDLKESIHQQVAYANRRK